MEQELVTLLDGAPEGRDLLGLTAVAGGGLSAADLAALTGTHEPDVRRLLRTVAGRSFDVRPSRWQPATRPVVYLLGHEELQVTALDNLAPDRLDDHRRRLHEWAEGHRVTGWPEHTPEYLLRGYFRMLSAERLTDRLFALATDPARHDRILDVSGSDLHALGELDIAQQVVQQTVPEDRIVLARLALHRERLVHRGQVVPANLPAVWASLGHVARAEALARLLPGARHRTKVQVEVAAAAARAGATRGRGPSSTRSPTPAPDSPGCPSSPRQPRPTPSPMPIPWSGSRPSTCASRTRGRSPAP